LSEADEGHADLGIPAGLQAKKSSGHWDIDLSWEEVEGCDSYRIYRKVTSIGSWEPIASDVLTASYTDDFNYLAQLYYRVSAVMGDYEGQPCKEVNRWTSY
jgi:hypothetical protein